MQFVSKHGGKKSGGKKTGGKKSGGKKTGGKKSRYPFQTVAILVLFQFDSVNQVTIQYL